jgi:hypothetical protein
MSARLNADSFLKIYLMGEANDWEVATGTKINQAQLWWFTDLEDYELGGSKKAKQWVQCQENDFYGFLHNSYTRSRDCFHSKETRIRKCEIRVD